MPERQEKDVINKAYQSIFTALSGYSKGISSSYHGNILDLAQRLEQDTKIDASLGNTAQGDLLNAIKNNNGDLVNWRSDTRLQTIRDIEMVVDQFPDLALACSTALEAMCDGDIVNGGMKFDVSSKLEGLDPEGMINKLEQKYHIKYNLRNTAYSDLLTHGEYYVILKKISEILNFASKHPESIDESVSLLESVQESSIDTKGKLKKDSELATLYESAETVLKGTMTEDEANKNDMAIVKTSHEIVDGILSNIKMHESYEQMMIDQFGLDGLKIIAEGHGFKKVGKSDNMFENIVDGFSALDGQDKKTSSEYDKIKGCYLKWCDATRMVPIRLGDVEIGYYLVYYGNTNLATKSNFANGVVDVTQINEVSTDQDFLLQISQLLVANMNLPFIQKNIDLVNEIAAILMETQFRKKEVEFTFIPKDDVVAFKINVDTNGNGTSMFARSLFNARLYTMLLMNAIITILNNRPTRTYKIRRDPRTNSIAGTVQRFKEKLFTKRVSVDDVWSYSGAINKIGAPTDMVIPVDADGNPPFTKEIDEGANIDINTPFMEMIKKNAIALTGVPNAMINQQDEIEFSKLAQMSQAKLLNFVKSLKIDINNSTTELYRKLFMLEFDLSEDEANAISVQIPDTRSNDISILNEMLQTFSTIFEQLSSVLLTQDESTTADGKPSTTVKNLKYELMKMFVPSLDYNEIEKIKKEVGMQKTEDDLNDQRRSISDFSDEDIENEVSQGQ